MPSLRPTMGIFVGLPLALGAAAAPGCSSDSTLPLGGQCSLTSDCNSPLACIFEKCHQQCNTSQDCSMGARCVAGGGGEGGVAHVCQFSEEATCAKAGCPGNLVCGADQQCRAPCQVYDDCRPGQFCVSVNGTSACYQTNAAPDQATLMAAGIESADGSVIVAGSPNSVVSVAGDSGSDATATGGDGANAGDGGNDGTASGGNDGSVDSAALDGTSADATLDSTAASDALMEAFVPNPDAGCLGFTPTNFSPLLVDAGPCGGGPDVVVSRAGVVLTGPNDTDPGSAPRFPFAVTISMNDPDMTKADLYVLHSLTV
ncbi:MAG TPA: hypothetical protein VGY54_02795, partial [Polyangiaceae bacterium]|nr:hypothetical protein [Polyangiaceae bacterium]